MIGKKIKVFVPVRCWNCNNFYEVDRAEVAKMECITDRSEELICPWCDDASSIQANYTTIMMAPHTRIVRVDD